MAKVTDEDEVAAADDGLTLDDVGEAGAVRVLSEAFARGSAVEQGIGDDAAIVRLDRSGLAMTTDMLQEDHDFRFSYVSWRDLGWKSLAVNLSDVSAMAAEPLAAVIGLALPGTVLLKDLRAFAEGAQEACRRLAPGCSVVGGDLSKNDTVTVSVTAVGQLVPGTEVTRRGASPGDRVVYCGQLGHAAGGLQLLERYGVDAVGRVPAAQRDAARRAVRAQLHPEPPVSRGPELGALGATAMIDVSDGLARDAGRIARASGVSIEFDQRVFPKLVGELAWARFELGSDPWQLVFGGGEDFGLLATLPRTVRVPEGMIDVGVVQEGCDLWVSLGGRRIDYSGWDHFE